MSGAPVLVLGGGISGLATAWWLAQAGHPVELWDTSERPGGKIQSHRESGYLTEPAAGILVNYRQEVDRLVEAAGLLPRKRQRDPRQKRYLLRAGRLHEVPMQMHRLLASPLWSWRGRLRMASELIAPGRCHPGESVSSFVRRRLGDEALQAAFAPFVAGTLASDPEQAEALSVLPRLVALEQRYGSITAGILVNRLLHRRRPNQADTFSFNGGMSELVEALAAHPEIHLQCGRRVQALGRSGSRWWVEGVDARGSHRRQVAQLVLALPACQAAELLLRSDPELSRLLSGIEYAPVAVLHQGFARDAIRHPLDGTGFLATPGSQAGCNGNLWMSQLFPGRTPEGRVLLTSYLGGAMNPGLLEQDDRALQQHLLQGLAPLLGIQGDPEYLRIDRHPQALPLYHGRHSERCRQIEQRTDALPGLQLVGNFLHGVSVRDRVVQGLECARRVARDATTEAPAVAPLSLAGVH